MEAIEIYNTLKSKVTVDPPLAPLNKGGWGDRHVAPVYRNGINN